MPRTALITGASSGLGAEYARQLASQGAALVLVGRSANALQSVADEVSARGGSATVIVADLLTPDGLALVVERVSSVQHPIDLLINNAGFGLPLEFANNDVKAELDHLTLHVAVPLQLTHAALQVMRERGGRILNVASIAAYIPRSTYGACKQWLVSFSRWANSHYDNVSVTAVCPGYTHTNFHERMGLAPGHEGIPGWMWLNAADVVAESLRDVARGKAVSIPSLKYKLIAKLTAVLPDRTLARMGSRGR